MNVIDEIKEVIDKLNKIDEYNSTLSSELSSLDNKQQDLLHYIENNKINILWCYRMIKEIKSVREKRRKVKNDMDVLIKYRQFLLSELFKKEKSLGKKYNNKKYTEEELQKILKGA